MDFPWMYIYATWAQDYKYVSRFCIGRKIKELLKKNLKKWRVLLAYQYSSIDLKEV